MEDLPNKFIPYNVTTRWNSTYRMLKDGIAASKQIERYIQLEPTRLPAFTSQDWTQLHQIVGVLSKFDKFTLSVSKSKPQLSLSVALYYEMDDYFQDATNRRNQFAEIDESIAIAVYAGLAKYKKYYAFVDEIDIYYIAMVLDPRFKYELLKQELEDEESALVIIGQLRAFLHCQYPMDLEPVLPPTLPMSPKPKSLESRLLEKIQGQSKQVSDIDRYFDDGVINVSNVSKDNWLFE